MKHTDDEIIQIVLNRMTHGDAFRYSADEYKRRRATLEAHLREKLKDREAFKVKYQNYLHKVNI